MADGNGHITIGSDDFVQGSTASVNPVTGIYAVEDDGTGIMMLSVGSAQMELAFTISSDSSLTWIDFDSFASGAGGARLQNTAAFASTPTGTFVFHIHSALANTGAQGAVSTVGTMTINSGSITGQEDVVRAGIFSSPTISGSLTAPDSKGTGTLSLTDSEGFTSTFSYYVIDSNTLNLVETDSAIVNGQSEPRFGSGRIEAQSNVTFGNGSLQGSFVFSGSGEALNTVFSVVTVGAFTTDGNGKITGGSYDSVLNGTPIANAGLTGIYSVDPSGRATLTLTPQSAGLPSIPEVAWMVSPSQAFFLVDIPGRAEDGTLTQQQGAPFSNASLNGQLAFSMFGGDNLSPSQVDRVGVATFNGSTFTVTDYFVNRGGSRNQTKFAGVPYTVSPNGRVTASVSGLTNALVMYLVSNSGGPLILEDPATEIAGGMTQQQSP